MSTDENGFRKVEWQDGQWEPSDDDDADGLPVRPHGPGLPEADLQLLELAARAIGAVRVEVVESENWVNLHFEDGSTVFGWNPLLHSDDTFNLAADLELDIMHRVVGRRRVEVLAAGGPLIQEFYEGDRKAATRRAVTRTAAEIERQKSS